MGRVNAALIAANKPPMGFINPWLYSTGVSAINDVTAGASIGCNSFDLIANQAFDGGRIVPNASFPAVVGWDAVTGLGTPDVGKIMTLAMK